MKRYLAQAFKRLRRLFNFHRPRFRQLDCIDLVFENKLLLLLSWDIVYASKVCVRPGRTVYHKPTGAAVCKLPMGTDRVDIIVCNVWRSTKVSFPLKHLVVDHQTLRYFGEQFPESLAFTLKSIQPVLVPRMVAIDKLPLLQLPAIQAPTFTISFNQLQFNDYVA